MTAFDIPAVCPVDGTVFPSGFAMGGKASATIAGSRAGPCPTCGGFGEIPNGFYRLIDDTLNVTAASGYSEQQIARVIEVLDAARNSPFDVAAVAQALDADAPEVAAVLRSSFLPKNLGEWCALLTLLIMALTLLQAQLAANDPPAPPADIAVTVVVQVENQPSPTVPNPPRPDEPPGQSAGGGPHRP